MVSVLLGRTFPTKSTVCGPVHLACGNSYSCVCLTSSATVTSTAVHMLTAGGDGLSSSDVVMVSEGVLPVSWYGDLAGEVGCLL